MKLSIREVTDELLDSADRLFLMECDPGSPEDELKQSIMKGAAQIRIARQLRKKEEWEQLKKSQEFYPKKVREIAYSIISLIEIHFPGLTKKTFDNFGYPTREGSPAQERAELCVYIELMKAGAFKDGAV